MRALFFFDAMLTPKIITLVYWLVLVGLVVTGVSSWFSGYDGFTLTKFGKGLGLIVGGGLAARIWCELLIVLFKIHENIRKIAGK